MPASPETSGRARTANLCLTLALALPPASFAAEIPVIPALAAAGAEQVDNSHDYVSKKFVGFISSVDRFFGNERNFQESNRSVLQLDLYETFLKAGDRKLQLAGKAKLHLPSTEERLHLLLESDPEKNNVGETTGPPSPPPNQLVTPDNYGIAVRFEKEAEGVLHYSSDVGIKVRSPVEPYARMRVSMATSRELWRIKLAQSLFWFSQPGAGETTQLDVEHALGEPALFRATSTVTWMHLPQQFDLRQDFAVIHTLDERHALLYETSAVGASRPQMQVNDYIFSLRYRQQLDRHWMFVEINPQLHYPKANDYELTPVLLLKLEMLFDKI